MSDWTHGKASRPTRCQGAYCHASTIEPGQSIHVLADDTNPTISTALCELCWKHGQQPPPRPSPGSRT